MSKRARSASPVNLRTDYPAKNPRAAAPLASHTTRFSPIKISSAQAAAAVDAEPPFGKLVKAQQNIVKMPRRGECVVYWMRMSDLRIADNKALSLASDQAQKDAVPLVVLFVLSPQDFIAHDRSARRIDFLLRNLAALKTSFDRLHIPLQTVSITPRASIPLRMIDMLETYNCTRLFANIEYEVDELRRDTKICQLASTKGIQANFVHDKCVIEPGVVLTKQSKPYTVYSPYQKNWLVSLNTNIQRHLKNYPLPTANLEAIRTSAKYSELFDCEVPSSVPGFELDDADRQKMQDIWPHGEETALQILQRFICTKARSSQLGAVDPLTGGTQECEKNNRISKYDTERDRADRDTTSRLRQAPAALTPLEKILSNKCPMNSPYLASGVISVRACVRETMLRRKSDIVDGSSSSGTGRWIQEIAWRDFYTDVLVNFPRVSMGRPFLEKFAGVVWEKHQIPEDITTSSSTADVSDGEVLTKWKMGKTGVPIVDAAMRCIKEMGWVHNRARMISAMYLTKDLMIDWRVGERYFMEMLVDGDLASNNGGWQWCASTGTDACPYFRIFNPYTQSGKVDPTGEFIRCWVPELRKLRGPELYNPSLSTAEKLGYPKPIIAHKEARDRALRRYKTPGNV